VSKDVDAKAVEYAKEFLKLIGKPSDDISVNMCERCHIDNTDLYGAAVAAARKRSIHLADGRVPKTLAFFLSDVVFHKSVMLPESLFIFTSRYFY
jgi:hypothetical protein